MKARLLLVVLLIWLSPLVPALAQNPNPVPLVGVLRLDTQETVKPVARIFLSTLAALGHVDGQNIRVDFRLAEGHAERFPQLAEELVTNKPQVIVASGDAAVRAAQRATKTIPIIAIVDDIVGSGLISSLARPGGNITGVSILATELDGKKLDILRRIVQSGRRFAVLSDPSSAQARPQQLIDTAAKALGVELITEEVRNPDEFGRAFASFQREGAEGLILRSSPLLFGFREELCTLSLVHKIPAIGQNRDMAMRGAPRVTA